MHRAWMLTKKDDIEYKKNTNLKQRERYHARRIKKIAESTDNDRTLGENDSPIKPQLYYIN
jgi:hypothetical protein